MRARFIGGSRDGQMGEVHGAAKFLVVVLYPEQSSTGDEFNWINLDHVWNGRPPPPCRREFYKRTGHIGDTAVYTFDRIEEPSTPTASD